MNFLVYKYTSPSGKVYIGVSRRTLQTRRGYGYGHNQRFRNAIKKYGWNNFTHEVVAEGLTEDEAKLLEKKLIAEMDATNPNKGYNISLGGSATFAGLKHTEEAKEKIRKANLGKVVSDETRQRLSKALKGKMVGSKSPMYGKPKSAETIQKQYDSHRFQMKAVDKLDLDGNILCTYESINSAARANGITKQSIRSCLIGKSKQSKGNKWQYHNAKGGD